ncbi:hypothetical protein PF005_g1715 [Phytophthora fragariae]|uniref:Pectate lyase n=1 Tax=Phytophthora fragariae TaxID=53985 RepID=A0A6A4DXV1_9STRA|nr:hypothetical protein PF003_g16640 [Phytophthora fragariae]KAE8947421.1 hypothetical protein PF009_g2998 [Phytophthora fragariae]KAE9000903.1 hypothetical protein PF011_g13982 [Phytophthora fragariae]KAE9105890.1 hypothetical protein PF010_g12828 [Phytophthora fragariae]KAE9137103.1 hypothetical protein PF007_g1946 [Phytophthora fragariae]
MCFFSFAICCSWIYLFKCSGVFYVSVDAKPKSDGTALIGCSNALHLDASVL